jgi:hypothetical protein
MAVQRRNARAQQFSDLTTAPSARVYHNDRDPLAIRERPQGCREPGLDMGQLTGGNGIEDGPPDPPVPGAAAAHFDQVPDRVLQPYSPVAVLPRPGQCFGRCFPAPFLAQRGNKCITQTRFDVSSEPSEGVGGGTCVERKVLFVFLPLRRRHLNYAPHEIDCTPRRARPRARVDCHPDAANSAHIAPRTHQSSG